MKRTRSFYGDSEYKKRYSKRARRNFERKALVSKNTAFTKGYSATRPGSIRAALRSDPFPTSQIIKLRYCETIELDASTAATNIYYFRANSIYDPNFSGTGHQPYAHDTLATVYNHYQVVKSVCSATFAAVDPAAGRGSCHVGLAIEDGTTFTTTIDTVCEQKAVKHAVLPAMQKVTLRQGYNADIHFPIETPQATTASFGSNPNEVAYFKLFHQYLNVNVDPFVVSVFVQIDFTVKVWELKALGQS